MRNLSRKTALDVLFHLIGHGQLLVAWRDNRGVHLDEPFNLSMNGPFIQITVNDLEPKRSRRHA